MTRVIFPITRDGNRYTYPDDRGFFKNTMKDGQGNMIAEYSGELTLTEYNGEWPLPVYNKELTSKDLIHLFTFDEWEEIESLTQPAAIRFLSLLEKREDLFSIENTKVTQFLDAIAANTSISNSRIQEIKKGIKI